MIADIEGAAPEPTRRRHVAVLSAAIAAVSLALLVALVVPSARVSTPVPAAAPAPSAGPVLTVISNPILWWLRIDLATECADGTTLIPPYHVAFDAGAGRIFAGHFDGGTGVSVPVMYAFDAQAGVATVTCATSDNVPSLIDLGTIAR